jgi:hypothetical protein
MQRTDFTINITVLLFCEGELSVGAFTTLCTFCVSWLHVYHDVVSRIMEWTRYEQLKTLRIYRLTRQQNRLVVQSQQKRSVDVDYLSIFVDLSLLASKRVENIRNYMAFVLDALFWAASGP